MRVIFLALVLFMFGCQKQNINPSNSQSMDYRNIFYTQEGKPYTLITATKILKNVAVGTGIEIKVNINKNPLLPVDIGTIEVNDLDQRIIPVMLTYSATQIVGNVEQIDIASPYFAMLRGSALSTDQQSSQTKLFPYVKRQYYNDNKHYNYSLEYADAVFSESDFIDPSGKLLLFYGDTEASGFTGNTPILTVPNGNYNIVITFIYFQLITLN